jgi:hypothetical protein
MLLLVPEHRASARPDPVSVIGVASHSWHFVVPAGLDKVHLPQLNGLVIVPVTACRYVKSSAPVGVTPVFP